MHSPFSTGVQRARNWVYVRYGRVPALLAHEGPGDFEIQSQGETKVSKPECISYLLELCNDVKQSPMRLIRLLIYLTSTDLEAMRTWPSLQLVLDIHHILVVTRSYCLGSRAGSPIVYRYELARLLTHSRDLVMRQWDKLLIKDNQGLMSALEANDEFGRRYTEVIRDLMALKLTPFGVQTSRLIICVRPLCGLDAVAGYLGMHDG
jgi:hypothetical protein